MGNNWDGKERRCNGNRDHDILIEIRGDLKNLVKTFEGHIDQDTKSFEAIEKRLGVIEKFYWGVVGVFVVIEILMKIIK